MCPQRELRSVFWLLCLLNVLPLAMLACLIQPQSLSDHCPQYEQLQCTSHAPRHLAVEGERKILSSPLISAADTPRIPTDQQPQAFSCQHHRLGQPRPHPSLTPSSRSPPCLWQQPSSFRMHQRYVTWHWELDHEHGCVPA